jgi:alkaline phosphatase
VVAVSEEDPDRFEYITESSNTATAMSTGMLTSRARVGTSAGTDVDVETIMEKAAAAGMGTGVVTTASVTDATPASFYAHVNHRFCEGPDSMEGSFDWAPKWNYDCNHRRRENGGRGSISVQIARSEMDVVLGGGLEHFDQPMADDVNQTVLDHAADNGFSIATSREALMNAAPDGRLLGLFSSSTMPVRMRGVDGAKAELLTKDAGAVVQPEPFACESNPDFDEIPLLAEMAKVALDKLSRQDSFMLMIESASIDKQSHARQPCGHIGEVEQLDDALGVAMAFAESHPETLILVTADHSQDAQIVGQSSMLELPGFGSPGFFARVRTPEGSVLGVNYASTDFPGIGEHTGGQVPLYAMGPGVDQFPILIEQTDIFNIAASHLGLADSWPK